MRNLKLAFALAASLIAFACPALAQNEFATPAAGKTVVGFQVMCQNGSNQAVPCSSAVPLQIGGTFSATLGGFTPSLSNARGTPIAVTISDSSGPLPTGTVVDVSNVGSNPMYCNVNGVPATAADKLIASNSWFEFTIPAGGTALHCIATGGSTTANMVGGAGLGTGAGGGSSGGGSGGNVNLTQILGAAPSATNPLWVSPATGATFPINAAALPLPAGAATQTTSAAILSALGTPFQAGASIGNTQFGISGTLPAFAATPTFNLGTLNGAATSAAQTTAQTSLSSIDTKTPALGQALAAASTPVILPAATITTLTPPAAITGFALSATQGATTDAPATVPTSATAASEIALLKALTNVANSATPACAAAPCVTTIGNVGEMANVGGTDTKSIKCGSSIVYDASTSGSTQLVALSGSTSVYVCGYTIMASGTVNVKLITGTGTACVTGAASITPAYQLTAQAGVADGANEYRGLKGAASSELCINTSAGVAVQAIVYFTQF